MKTQFSNSIFSILIFFPILVISCCKNNDCDTTEKVYIKDKEKYIPYQGYEGLKFLHDQTDTQTFVGQGKETYFIKEMNGGGACPKDHEGIRIKFVNPHSKEVLTFSLEYDELFFNHIDEVGFKFSYAGQTFIPEFKNSGNDSVLIGNKKYINVGFYGSDTNNYIARSPVGILRMHIKGVDWDLVQ